MNIFSLKRLKESVVADAVTFDGDDDLVPMMEVHRGDDLVALITALWQDKELILGVAGLAAGGYGATRLSMVFDAHMSSSGINPATNEQWKNGEMQAACEEGACDLGLITDCLVIQDVWRDGLQELRSLPYHVHKDTKQVTWAALPDGIPEIASNRGEDVLQGYLVDVLGLAFSQPDLSSGLLQTGVAATAFGLDAASARTHIDCAVTKILMESEVSVLLNGLTEEGLEIIRMSMDSWPLSVLLKTADTDPN